MKKFILAVTLIMLTLSIGCGAQKDLQKSEDKSNKEIKIAVMGDKGLLLEYNPGLNRGMNIAAEDFNKEYKDKGYSVSIELYDDKFIYEKAISITNELAKDDNVDVIFATQNFAALDSMSEILKDRNKIMLTVNGATSKVMNKGYANVLNNTFLPEKIGEKLGNYICDNGFKRVAIYYSSKDVVQKNQVSGLVNLLNKKNIMMMNIDDSYEFMTGGGSEKVCETLDVLDVDCVVVFHITDEALTLIRIVKKHNPNLEVLSDYSIDVPESIDVVKPYAENVKIAHLLMSSNTKELNELKKRYEIRYNADFNCWVSQGYDSVKMMAEAIVSCGTSDADVLSEYLKTKEINGVNGKLKFDKKGNILGHEPQIFEIKNSLLQILEDTK